MTNLNNPNIIILIVITMTTSLAIMSNQTSMMCVYMIMSTMMTSLIISLNMKLSKIPFIMFLTMVGGLMIIFLYFTATLWMKKSLQLTSPTSLSAYLLLTILFVQINPNMEMIKKHSPMPMLNININKFTILLLILLMAILMFTIKMFTKMNCHFRRNPKIW